jgi:hypothetical protein
MTTDLHLAGTATTNREEPDLMDNLRESIRAEALDSVSFASSITAMLPWSDIPTLTAAEILIDLADIRERLAEIVDRIEDLVPPEAGA